LIRFIIKIIIKWPFAPDSPKLPKGWSQKVSTSCTVIDAEYTVLSKEEDNIQGESDTNSDEKFEDFS